MPSMKADSDNNDSENNDSGDSGGGSGGNDGGGDGDGVGGGGGGAWLSRISSSLAFNPGLGLDLDLGVGTSRRSFNGGVGMMVKGGVGMMAWGRNMGHASAGTATTTATTVGVDGGGGGGGGGGDSLVRIRSGFLMERSAYAPYEQRIKEVLLRVRAVHNTHEYQRQRQY